MHTQNVMCGANKSQHSDSAQAHSEQQLPPQVRWQTGRYHGSRSVESLTCTSYKQHHEILLATRPPRRGRKE
jgi:hypothetical protein